MVIGYKGTIRDRRASWESLIVLRSIIKKEPLDKWKKLYAYMFREYIT